MPRSTKKRPERRVGRRKPYTQIGIERMPCGRCGRRPSVEQWNCCANDNLWVPLCLACDLDLNRLALQFCRVPGRARLFDRYVKRVRKKYGDAATDAALRECLRRQEAGDALTKDLTRPRAV